MDSTLESVYKVSEDIFQQAKVRFDIMLQKQKLFWEPSSTEVVEESGFTFQFRIAPSIQKKPILTADDPGRNQASGPFVNPDPDFVLARLGPTHILELSKFCVDRPSFILHTNQYEVQTNDLNEMDLHAAWAVLQACDMPQLMLYNCGVNAGSSQGHKHMQIFPRPDQAKFPLFMDSLSTDRGATTLANVPYRHFATKFTKRPALEELMDAHANLLRHTRAALETVTYSNDYNVVLADEWMILIPRSHKGHDNVGANGAGMLGMIWLRDQEERDGWEKLGMTKHLAYLGIPGRDGVLL